MTKKLMKNSEILNRHNIRINMSEIDLIKLKEWESVLYVTIDAIL